jgi:glutamate transport system substrate-binding protein
MRGDIRPRRRGLLGLLIGVGLAAGTAGCVTISPVAVTGNFPVADGVRLDNSPTFQRMTARDGGKGRIVIGVKDDQPGLGYYDAERKAYSGFDVEIAELVAARLGFSRLQIQFVSVQSAGRESALENGSVDMIVASYSYSAARAQLVTFAGPYFETIEGLLVRSDETDVTRMDSLTSSNEVCSTSGSTSLAQISRLTSARTAQRDNFSECVSALKQKSLDGVYSDLAVLAGYAAQDPEHLKLLEVPDAAAPQLYGIGLPLGDQVLRQRLDYILTAAEKDGTWQAIFNATLAPSGITARTPPDGVWTP